MSNNVKQRQTTSNHLIVIGGPTASGKTGVAIELARRFGAPIVSADSRQFYREMTIGTAKPTAAELAAAPHHFTGHLSVETPYSVGDYERAALPLLERLFEKNEYVILTGGSGLFINAVTRGLDHFPEVPAAVKQQLRKEFTERGLQPLLLELERNDPDYYALVDRQNPARVLRALEVIRASGEPFSKFRTQQPKERPFRPIYLAMEHEREVLYDRINRRVNLMLESGLVEEARALYPLRHLRSLQTVGYQELFAYFAGETDLATAVELIQRNSRRYAKRQMTWLRRDGFWTWFAPENLAAMERFIRKESVPV